MNRRNLFYYLSNQHNAIVKLLLFCVTVLVLVSLLPHEGRFRKLFERGRTWRHETLYAPFSFGILKSEAELQKDREDLKLNARKYFRYNDNLTLERLRNIPAEFDTLRQGYSQRNALNAIPLFLRDSKQESFLLLKLQNWYKQGIVRSGTFSIQSGGEIIERNEQGVRPINFDEYLLSNRVIDSIAVLFYGSPLWENRQLEQFFRSMLIPNVEFDENMTDAMLQEAFESVSKTHGLIKAGDPIIRRGEVIDDAKYQILISLRNEYESKQGIAYLSDFWLKTGQAIVVALILLLLYLFIIFLRPEIFEDSIKLSLISLLIIGITGSASFIVSTQFVGEYAIPFCMLPIVIRSFFDTRLALFTHVLTMVIVSFIVPDSFEFLVIQILGGIMVVFTALNLRQRSRLFTMIATLFIVYCCSYAGLRLMAAGSLDAINLKNITRLGISATLSLFAFPLIYFIERVFGYTSDISLLELSDTNSPLLREMAVKAPGTFQHSLQVANLSEAAIGVIGGNMLLARTGALYHDIGKIEFARYFIENQNTGINPHDELDFDESAQLIISHVQRGLRLGRKHKLPDRVLDFIRTHHGTSRVHYFYKSFLKNYPEEEVDEAAFRYPGPIPFSRETAVVMMADSVEARSRSLNAPSKEQISQLVDDVIQRQMDDQQYINADITLKDISKIKKVFKKMLMNMYHVRIAFPD